MAGLRNRVVYDYGQIDLEIVWDTVTAHLPLLRETLREFFEEVPTDLPGTESRIVDELLPLAARRLLISPEECPQTPQRSPPGS